MLTVYVDLPALVEGDNSTIAMYKNVATFVGKGAKEQALKYVKENWGADDDGRVGLLTIDRLPDDDEERDGEG